MHPQFVTEIALFTYLSPGLEKEEEDKEERKCGREGRAELERWRVGGGISSGRYQVVLGCPDPSVGSKAGSRSQRKEKTWQNKVERRNGNWEKLFSHPVLSNQFYEHIAMYNFMKPLFAIWLSFWFVPVRNSSYY